MEDELRSYSGAVRVHYIKQQRMPHFSKLSYFVFLNPFTDRVMCLDHVQTTVITASLMYIQYLFIGNGRNKGKQCV